MAEPLSPEMEALCASAIQYGASDLLLHEGRPPQVRLEGRLTPLDSPPLTAEFFDALWKSCRAGDKQDFDTSLTSSGSRFRVNLLNQLGQRAAVLRRIRNDIPDLETLGAPADLIRDWCGRKSGLVLVCGPTGSGKSTTLAAAIEWMNSTMSRHVVTIEDPIEYLFTGRSCLFTQREVGIDTPSFAEGLRRSLRQNPDVIFVGEIRDALTATTAIQASETGHLVLATLHSSSCADAVERLQLFFPMDERDAVRKTLSGQLLGVLCQRLLPATQGGVALAAEYFTNVGAVRKFIAEGKLTELSDLIARSDVKTGRDALAALAQLVREGKITEEVAASVAENPQELQRILRGISSSSQSTRR
ncbi:MAG: type IV pilus twitching motility protein PilT [Terrimicrobiaceae bacterium]